MLRLAWSGSKSIGPRDPIRRHTWSVALAFTVFGRLEPMARRTDRISRSASASDKKSRFVSIPSRNPTERITISDALEASPLILPTAPASFASRNRLRSDRRSSVKARFGLYLHRRDSSPFLDLKDGGPGGFDVTTLPFNDDPPGTVSSLSI